MASNKMNRQGSARARHFNLEEEIPMEDQAEDTLVRVLEERRARANANSPQTWNRSVEGEEPPLMSEVPTGLRDDERGQRPRGGRPPLGKQHARPNIVDVGLRVRAMKQAGMWKSSKRNVISLVAEHTETAERHKKDTPTEFDLKSVDEEEEENNDHNIFEGVGGENHEVGASQVAAAETDADRLISGAMVVDNLFNADDQSSLSTGYSGSATSTINTNDETLPLTGTQKKQRFGWLPFNYGATGTRRRRHRHRRRKGWCPRCIRRPLRRALRSNVWEALRPTIIKRGIKSFVLGTFLVGVFPLLAIAAILYYAMGNPTPDFLEGVDASTSYWLIFASRKLLTLSLAGLTQFLLVDVLALRSKTAVKIIGPFVTLFAIQAKGWPLQAMLWALWDLFIFHGDNSFQQNWLYFTGIEIFSKANPGGDILKSSFYLRTILAVLVAGLATAIKRTVFALHFGKKSFHRYKVTIEKLLVEILIVSEVAELSKETQKLDADSEAILQGEAPVRGLNTKWQSMRFEAQKRKSVGFKDEVESDDEISSHGINNDSSIASESDNDDDGANDEDDSDDDQEEVTDSDRRKFMLRSNSSDSVTSSSKMVGIKTLLDRWEEPVNKLDKAVDPSIHDILQFRKAITFMDDRHPFSLSFGPASTRDECIKSAEATYNRLMLICPEAPHLPFSILSVLATDEDGLHDRSKMSKLRRVFRPDRYNELSMLAFVQSCDAVYRKLRYFRASVGNSSVIDKVLCEGLDKLFFFVLALVICAVMDYNPWTLLVSLSTLVVSFAFAVGPSASKYIEGLLLIAARSPYDLGDRILIVGSENVINHGVTYSWLVEDINLYSTTLRFAATNEVATVSNGSIAGSRIVNCARSPKALISITLKFMIYITDEEAAVMRDAIKQYVNDRPRTWVQVIFFRSDDLDPDEEYILYQLRVQHRKTWQDAAAILRDRAELHKFCYEAGERLGILYDSPMRRLRIYRPGEKEIRPIREDTENEEPSGKGGEANGMTLEDALLAAGLSSSALH